MTLDEKLEAVALMLDAESVRKAITGDAEGAQVFGVLADAVSEEIRPAVEAQRRELADLRALRAAAKLRAQERREVAKGKATTNPGLRIA